MSDPADNDEFEPLTLVFLVGGQAVLEEGEGDSIEQVWASDDDEDFVNVVDHPFLTQEDTEAILAYLVEQDMIEEADAPDVAIEVESYEAEDLNDLVNPS